MAYISHILHTIFGKSRRYCLLFLCSIFIFTGCSSQNEKQETAPDSPPRDNTPQVLEPQAPGTDSYTTDLLSMDLSNASEGYLTLTYLGSNEKVKFQIAAPDKVTYTYLVPQPETEIILPLTGGDGTYDFTLLESVDIANDRYAIVYTQSTEVVLTDEFLPYLTPNVYVNYASSSNVVKKGVELADDCYCDLDVIEHIYNYVTQTITYDTEKAKSIAYGYIPNPDETLSSESGICFDYAALMTAMLRSQRIPTKLQVGYAGEAYHAWISCYVEEIGWINNIIEFDGKNWSLMDPTLAANNSDTAVQEYIGDGSNYIVKYTY